MEATPTTTAASSGLPLRELSGWEEEYLERHGGEANTAALCNEVLARCLVDPGADAAAARATVRGLLVAERDRALVDLRRRSLGPLVSAQARCSACGEQSEIEFSVDALDLGFDVPERRFEYETADGVVAALRLPTAGDQAELADAGVQGDAEARSWVLARCIERYGDDEGVDLAFVRALPVRTRAELEAAIDARLPDVDLSMALDCSQCGAPNVAPFDVANFFFRVDRPGARTAAGRPHARAQLSLGRARHPRAHAGPAPGLPHVARRGVRRCPAGRAGLERSGMTGRGTS